MVRAEGLEPSRGYPQRIFVPSTAFAAPLRSTSAGLRSGLSLHRALETGIRCCPSSLYTFPAGKLPPGLARDCHFQGSPEFGQFCIAGFPASTQVLTQVRCVCHSATPAWLALLYNAARGSRNPMGPLSPVCLPVPPPRPGLPRSALTTGQLATFAARQRRANHARLFRWRRIKAGELNRKNVDRGWAVVHQ